MTSSEAAVKSPPVSAALAALAWGSMRVVVVLGLLVWSDCRNRHAEATIQRTEEQRQRARSGRW